MTSKEGLEDAIRNQRATIARLQAEIGELRDKNAKDFQDYIHNISSKEEEIAKLKARLLIKDDDWIAAIQEVMDINGEWVHSDELQTLKEQKPPYHTSARQRIKESKETESKGAIK